MRGLGRGYDEVCRDWLAVEEADILWAFVAIFQ